MEIEFPGGIHNKVIFLIKSKQKKTEFSMKEDGRVLLRIIWIF